MKSRPHPKKGSSQKKRKEKREIAHRRLHPENVRCQCELTRMAPDSVMPMVTRGCDSLEDGSWSSPRAPNVPRFLFFILADDPWLRMSFETQIFSWYRLISANRISRCLSTCACLLPGRAPQMTARTGPRLDTATQHSGTRSVHSGSFGTKNEKAGQEEHGATGLNIARHSHPVCTVCVCVGLLVWLRRYSG